MYLGAAWWRKLRMTLWHNLSHYLTVSLATTDPSTTTSSKDTAGRKCDTGWTGHVSLSMGTLLIHLGLLLPDGNTYINISGIWGRGGYSCPHNNHSCLTIATPGPWALIDHLLKSWEKCNKWDMPLNFVFSFKTGVRTNWIGRAPRVSPTGTFPTADAGALEVCACAEEVEEGPQRRLCDPPDVYSRMMQCSGPGGTRGEGDGRCTRVPET